MKPFFSENIKKMKISLSLTKQTIRVIKPFYC
jgi:hypothetical protein